MDISKMLPSELIRVAVYDLTLCEKDSNYHIDMAAWHSVCKASWPFQNEVCFVCLAGSMMAKSLNMNRAQNGNPDNYRSEISLKLRAVDFFRQGEVTKGMYYYAKSLGDNIIPQVMLKDTNITPYVVDRSQFKQDMYDLARVLESEGY